MAASCRKIALLILLTAVLLVGCGPGAPSETLLPTSPTPTITVPTQLPKTVSLAGKFADPLLAVLDGQISNFEAENPDILVEVTKAPRDQARREWVAGKLRSGDTSLDLFQLDPTWTAELAAGAGLAPLDDLLGPLGVSTGAFVPGVIDANSHNGELVAIPWTVDAGFLFFRRDLLEKHGLAPPTTWAELQRTALEIKTKEGLPYGFVWQGAADQDLTCNTLEFVWAHGGDLFDDAGNVIFDSPQTRAALQQMNDFVLSGASPSDQSTYDRWKALEAFRAGDAVFMRNWYEAWPLLNGSDSPVAGKIGLVPLPASCLGGQSLGLSEHSLSSDQSARFLASLVGIDQQTQMALETDYLPVVEAAYEDPTLSASAPTIQQAHAGLAAARPQPSIPEYAQVSEAVYTQVNQMLAGWQSPAETSAEIQRLVEGILH